LIVFGFLKKCSQFNLFPFRFDFVLPNSLQSLATLTRGRFHQHLRAAFTSADPKSDKKHSQANNLFALLGFAHVKVSDKMLVK
jgi:hypothetical protein